MESAYQKGYILGNKSTNALTQFESYGTHTLKYKRNCLFLNTFILCSAQISFLVSVKGKRAHKSNVI